jgi:hypothetical protein
MTSLTTPYTSHSFSARKRLVPSCHASQEQHQADVPSAFDLCQYCSKANETTLWRRGWLQVHVSSSFSQISGTNGKIFFFSVIWHWLKMNEWNWFFCVDVRGLTQTGCGQIQYGASRACIHNTLGGLQTCNDSRKQVLWPASPVLLDVGQQRTTKNQQTSLLRLS